MQAISAAKRTPTPSHRTDVSDYVSQTGTGSENPHQRCKHVVSKGVCVSGERGDFGETSVLVA